MRSYNAGYCTVIIRTIYIYNFMRSYNAGYYTVIVRIIIHL